METERNKKNGEVLIIDDCIFTKFHEICFSIFKMAEKWPIFYEHVKLNRTVPSWETFLELVSHHSNVRVKVFRL